MNRAIRCIGVAAVALLLAACANRQREPSQLQVTRRGATLAPVEWPQVRLEAELVRLRAALAREVPNHAPCAGAHEPDRIKLVRAALATADVAIDRPQLIVVVDRNPRAQKMCMVLARADGPWQPIGGSKVSTGQAGRRGYFLTPTGVFRHSPAIVDYRAEGTFNENHIRGLGVKGMRVWDFGWQQAQKGWAAHGEEGEIRLLMHATDPDYLDQRLGRPASKGCVRIPAAMNRFLDRHGVLDASYELAAQDDGRLRAVLLPDREPTPLAGDTLVVIDTSSDPTRQGNQTPP